MFSVNEKNEYLVLMSGGLFVCILVIVCYVFISEQLLMSYSVLILELISKSREES